MLHDASGGHDAEIEFGLRARDGALDRALVHRHVLRVDDIPKPLDRNLGPWLELADAIELLGPVVFVLCEI